MRERKTLLSLFAVAALLAATSWTGTAADFKTGDMVDKDSWKKADGLLPPEILKHYREGEYSNKYVDWPVAKTTFPPDFKAGSDANEGKFTTSPEGTVIETATGKQPAYVLGFPFPKIDEKDPAAAVKIIWN